MLDDLGKPARAESCWIELGRLSGVPIRTRPEFRSGPGSGGIWSGSGRFDRYRWIKIEKRNIENIYIL